MFHLWTVPRFWKDLVQHLWKSLNLLTISIGSFIFLPFDMIYFNPCHFCLVLHNISFIVFHIFLMFDLLSSISCLKNDIFASRIIFFNILLKVSSWFLGIRYLSCRYNLILYIVHPDASLIVAEFPVLSTYFLCAYIHQILPFSMADVCS